MYYALCNLHRAHTNHTSFALDEHARQWRVSCTSLCIIPPRLRELWEHPRQRKFYRPSDF